MTNWVNGTVIDMQWWNDKLFSITLEAPIAPYKAGQFTKLAMMINDKKVARAYSFVNAPNEKNQHEFLLVKVDDGQLSPPLSALSEGDSVLIYHTASGFFTISEVPAAKTIWLLATGTAIGPFISMLNEQEIWQKFERVILVHGVRHQSDLVYKSDLTLIANDRPFTYIPVVSRETVPGYLTGRITTLLEDETLFEFTKTPPSPEQNQFMICGNPDMVKETSAILENKGFKRNRRATPGQITVEQYW